MNKDHFIRVGWYLGWHGQSYQIVAIDTVEQCIRAEHVHTREDLSLTIQELFTEMGENQALLAESLEQVARLNHREKVMVDTAGLPERLLKQAEHIIVTVESVELLVAEVHQRASQRGEPYRRTAALRQAITQIANPISLATFYKYRRLYEEHGASSARLATALRRSTYQQSKFSAAELHFIDTLVLRYYARSRPLRPITVYELGVSILKRTGGRWLDPEAGIKDALVEELLDPRIPMEMIEDNPEKVVHLTTVSLPSRAWFYGYLKWFVAQPDQGKAVVENRYGDQAWDQTYAVFDTFVTRASVPLQYVFADHALLDVYIVDEVSRSQVSRLWLTALIDAYSRSILGIALLDEYPSIMSIQSALKHAIWPKVSHQRLGLEAEWVCYGIPQQLSLDNAWAHHSHSLESLSREISRQGHYASIDLVFRPPYRARYGALIERFFGNLSAQIKAHLPGAIQGGHPRDHGQAAQEACLLYQDLIRIIHQLVLAYQHRPHSELGGMSPHEQWLRGLGMSSPLVPAKTVAMERLFWRLHPDTRVMTSKGISAFGMHYWSPQWGGAQRVGRDGQRIQYHFRYDPNDISRIALFRDGQWRGDGYAKELRLADGQTMSLSLSERRLAQQQAQLAGHAVTNWLHFITEVDQLTHQRKVEKRQAHRQQQPSATPVNRDEKTTSDYSALLAGFTADVNTKEDGS